MIINKGSFIIKFNKEDKLFVSKLKLEKKLKEMKEFYLCNSCNNWFEEKDIDHISYSNKLGGSLTLWIECKKCKTKYKDKEK